MDAAFFHLQSINFFSTLYKLKNIYLKYMQPMPPVCRILYFKKLNDSNKQFGFMVWQHTSNQTVLIVQVNMEPEIQS